MVDPIHRSQRLSMFALHHPFLPFRHSCVVRNNQAEQSMRGGSQKGHDGDRTRDLLITHRSQTPYHLATRPVVLGLSDTWARIIVSTLPVLDASGIVDAHVDELYMFRARRPVLISTMNVIRVLEMGIGTYGSLARHRNATDACQCHAKDFRHLVQRVPPNLL